MASDLKVYIMKRKSLTIRLISITENLVVRLVRVLSYVTRFLIFEPKIHLSFIHSCVDRTQLCTTGFVANV
jgi:hypothetical protein